MALLDRATRRATARKVSTPIGAHLDLPNNARQADKAYKQQQVYQTCSKSLQLLLEIGTEKYNMGEEILDFGTYKPTTVMETKKIGCHRR
jgi:hypothetical protein